MQFKFIIKDNRYNSYKKIAASLLILNAILFAFIAVASASPVSKFILGGTAIIQAVYAVYFWKYKKQKEKSFVVIYLITAITWIAATPSWYFSIVFLLLIFIQLKLESDSSITISKAEILVESFLKSTYEWKSLSNVILKDGLLTLDFKNNKILHTEPDWQLTVIEKEYRDLEKEFNDFCRQQLTQ